MTEPGPRQIYTSSSRRRGRPLVWAVVAFLVFAGILFAALTLVMEIGA